MAGFWICWALAVAGMMVGSGCAKKADESKPLSEIKAEAETMDVPALREQALAYKDAIMDLRTRVGEFTDRIKKIPIKEALGEEAKALRQEAQAVGQSLKALKERFDVYYGKLREKKADLSELTL